MSSYLYLFYGVLEDYTSGIAGAIAKSKSDAESVNYEEKFYYSYSAYNLNSISHPTKHLFDIACRYIYNYKLKYQHYHNWRGNKKSISDLCYM